MPSRSFHHLIVLTAMSLSILSCAEKDKQVSSIFHSNDENTDTQHLDMRELEEVGEIIAVTLSGPDTYFEWRGQSFGDQYELAADFARSKGLRIRMEIAHDSTELISKLQNGEADIIALPMPDTPDCILAAIQDSTKTDSLTHDRKALGWLTRASSQQLAEELNKWYTPDIKQKILAHRNQLIQKKIHHESHSHPRPKVKNAAGGIISDYDNLFQRYAALCRWDWKLLAAQCYQESAFDPNAVSWAGAQGLMQLMPSTARHYGAAENVFDPETNIRAAASLIIDLNKEFAEIHDEDERISFILASYNGGQGHVRDAMALTKKYGGNPHLWSDVRQYILALSDSKYYRDPVVKYGYLRGNETANYVSSIRSHWAYYSGIR